METIRVILFIGIATSLSACSLFKSTPEVTEAPVEAVESNSIEHVQKGFSLSIPKDNEWEVAKKTPYKVILSKPGMDKYEGYTIQALMVNLPNFESDDAFMEFMKSRMDKNNEVSGLKVLDQAINFVEGKPSSCIQYSSKGEDAKTMQKAKTDNTLILEMVNYTCRHPFKEKVGIYVAYAKRYYQTAQSADQAQAENISDYATQLFSNLNFSDLN